MKSGKARYWGVSGRNIEEVEELLDISSRNGKEPVSCLQNGYSLIGRDATTEGLFPLLRKTGLGVQAIGPHSAGVLTKPEISSFIDNTPNLRPKLSELINVVDKVALELNVPRSQVNVAWVLSHPEITTSLAAAETPEHVNDNLAGAMLEIPDNLLNKLNVASDEFMSLISET